MYSSVYGAVVLDSTQVHMTYADVMCVYSLESKGESLCQYKCCHEVMHLEQTRAVWREVRERGEGESEEQLDSREEVITKGNEK